MTEERITWDHSYFYVDGEKFFPLIRQGDPVEDDNSILITIPYLAEKETFDFLYEKANEALSKNKWIVWEFDFSWDKKPLFIQDASYFFSVGLWIGEFLEKFWIPFKESTLAFILFRGEIDLSSYFIWTEQQELLYQEKLIEYPSLEENDIRSFFAADVFSEYLQRLCSFLPDEAPVMCLLDVGSIKSSAKTSYMVSKERFGHVLLGLKNAPIALSHLAWEQGKAFGGWVNKEGKDPVDYPIAKIGVCLPCFEKTTSQDLTLLDDVLEKLQNKGSDFRVILEGSLHENWDGIDDLIVMTSLLGPQGLRKLRGFIAAGGRVVFFGSSLGLDNEISLASFLEETNT